MTCSPFRAHKEPLYFANKVLNIYDINDYIIDTFMYECLYGNIPDMFRNYFQRNADVHDHNLRNVNDLYVPYGRLDIRKQFSRKIAGPNLWNSLPSSVKNSETVHTFRKMWGIIQLREKGILKVIIHSLFPIDVWMRISEIC